MKLNIRVKLIGSFLIIIGLAVGVGVFALVQMRSIFNAGNYISLNTVPSVYAVGQIQIKVNNYRRQELQHILATDASAMKTREDNMAKLDDEITALIKNYQDNLLSDATDKQLMDSIATQWQAYKAAAAPVYVLSRALKTTEAMALLNGDPTTRLTALENTLAQDSEYNQTLAAGQTKIMSDTSASAQLWTIGLLSVAALVALALGLWMATSLSNAAILMVSTAEEIAQTDLPALEAATTAIAGGDLTRSVSVRTHPLAYSSADEMGDLARAFNAMITRLQGVGTNFAQMTVSLSRSVGQVAENANSVSAAAEQLAAAAEQAGSATGQQTEATTKTAHSVEEMKRAIDGVAKGAQDQSAAVNKASNVTTQITAAIQGVASNAQAVTRDAQGAAQAAKEGAKTVEATIKGMESIKAKVGVSAAKVQEMGQHSTEIGAIVETIEDIASQTNLLALNAAIEAARAGEHGAGFAVVADEVRKLAERATKATKEISTLIRGIQTTVTEAVAAMKEGTLEVETGAERANEAGEVLKTILTAAQAVQGQAEAAFTATQQMGALSSELAAATDMVSAVVEENTASTEQMAASSTEVTHAVENIASVGEELNAQVEEVAASATALSELALGLQQVVTQFKLPNQAPAALPAPARARA